jgi:hypothetical protein
MKCRTQSYFSDVKLFKQILQKVDWINQSTAKVEKHWTTDHLPQEDGEPYVPCARYMYNENVHILNNADLVNIWAHIKWVSTITSL